jgi:hypothetical protein
MFGFLKSDPRAKLEKRYKKLMSDAVQVQRSGDLRAYAKKMKEAEDVQAEIEALDGAEPSRASG